MESRTEPPNHSRPDNPMDDANLAKDPIASKIPQGKSYWLMVLGLMIAAGFWQYYVTYHYNRSKAIQWKPLSANKVQNSLAVGRPLLLWLVDLKPNATESLRNEANRFFKTPSSKDNPQPKNPPTKLETEPLDLLKSSLILREPSFKVPFHQKGGVFFMGPVGNIPAAIQERIGGEIQPGFYLFGIEKNAKPAYFSTAEEVVQKKTDAANNGKKKEEVRKTE